MKLTKKAAALLLAASLAVSVCATPVFAAENMGSKPGKITLTEDGKLIGSEATKVLYKVTESYAWSIPATIDFGENAGPESKTRVVDANLETGNGTVAGATNGTAPKIMVTKNVIGAGKKLQITVDTNFTDTNGEFYVETPEMTKTGPSTTKFEKLYYTITKPATTGDPEKKLTGTENEVLSVPSGTNTAKQELVFTLTTTSATAEKAGTYEGHVAFHSQLVY